MKSKLVLLGVLALALPLAVFADSESFTSIGGTFAGDSSGCTLTGATLTPFVGPNGTFFREQSGHRDVRHYSGNGTDGLNGVLLDGTFARGGRWGGEVQQPDGTYQYTRLAAVTGKDENNDSAHGWMMFVIDSPDVFPGTTKSSGTTATAVSVPEPSELSLLGTGLLGLMGAIRRKMKVQG